MARVTLTMDEALWRWVREAAAREGQSLSRFVAETVERKLGWISSDGDASGHITDEGLTPSSRGIEDASKPNHKHDT